MTIHAVALVEAQRVLGNHVQLAAKATECFAVDTVRVTGGVDIRTGLVDRAMNSKRGRVDRLDALHHKSFLVDEHQIRDADLGEVGGQWVEPKVVRQNRVADRDVTGHAFVVAAVGKDAESGGEVLFAVLTLFLGRVAGVCADLEGLAGASFAKGLDGGGWCTVGSGGGGRGDGGYRGL